MKIHKPKILIVEDDEIDQMALRRMMKQQELQYDFDIIGSVSEARKALESKVYDILITDYNLTDGDAFDILEVIDDIPAIVVTGAGNEEIAVEALRAGAYDYLVKDHGRKYLDVLPMIVDKAISHRTAEKQLKEYHDNLESLIAQRTEELASEKELVSTTLASMNEGVIAVDVNKRVLLLNRVAEKLTGWTFEDVCGKPVEEVLHLIDEKTGRPVESPVEESLKSGDVRNVSGCNILSHNPNDKFPVNVSAAPIRKTNNDIAGVVTVLRNVSEERKVDHMKNDFVSSVSHELRTPLTSIKAFTATIIRDPDMPDKTRNEFLRIIDEESNRLANLIEELLQISRIESDAIQITLEPVSLSDQIDKILPALQPLAEKKTITLAANVPAHLPDLNADAGKIESLLTNLINNAIKFTPDGGRVDIMVTHGDGALILTVKDTGMGIPKEDLNKIFDRFHRVHRPGKEIQGTGLGLAIVNKIVELHKARIEVESTIGKGTTFTVFFPLIGCLAPVEQVVKAPQETNV